MARLALVTGVVSPPRPDRWAARPTPLFGGVAIALGLVVPALIVLWPAQRPLAVIALGAIAALALGLVDDVRGLRPTTKLVGEVILASGLALGGVRAEILSFPPADFVLTVVWVIGMMNAVNLIDNMDGLAAGVAAIAGAVLVFMAPADTPYAGVVAASLAGGCLGFLVHNFPPAKVFMGDAGSLTLGFVLAALALAVTNTVASNVGLAVFGPLLALGLPIYDTALVTFVRRLEGRPLSKGGRDHTSHRLAALGLSERETVLSLYALASGLALLGLISSALGFAVLPVVALVVVGLILFGVFLSEAPTPSPGPGPGATRSHVLGAGRALLRFGGEVVLDVVLATIALFSAFLIRFESLPIDVWMPLFVTAAPFVIPLQFAAFVALGVYRALWRFIGVTDVLAIVRSAFVGTLAAGFIMLYPLGMYTQSRAVLLIDWVLVSVLVAGSRLSLVWLRHWFALRPRTGDRRVLIVGANETGEIALRLMLHSSLASYHPAGFLDDDPGKLRRRIAGVPVLGLVADLDGVAQREHADLVVLALDGNAQERQRVLESCARLGIECREFDRVL